MVLEEEDRGGGVGGGEGGVADAEADAKPSADAGREEGVDAKCRRRTRGGGRCEVRTPADLARLNDFFGSVNHAHVSHTRVDTGQL